MNASDSTPNALGSATVVISSLRWTLNPHRDPRQHGYPDWLRAVSARVTDYDINDKGSVETEDLDTIGDAAETENVSGNYAFTFTVPDLAPGKATVTLTQDDGQIGVGELTVATPLIATDPAEAGLVAPSPSRALASLPGAQSTSRTAG